MAKDVDQDSFEHLKQQYGAINNTPVLPSAKAALKMPGKKLNVSEHTKHHRLDEEEVITVPGLADYVFAANQVPFFDFEKDEVLFGELTAILRDMPNFVFDKDISNLIDQSKKVHEKIIGEGDSTKVSKEIQFANWINRFSKCMWEYAKKKGLKVPEPRSWNGETATKVISDGSTKQKPDAILYDPRETLMKCFESIRLIWEITMEEDFPYRTTNASGRRADSMFKKQAGRLFVPSLMMSNKQVGVTLYDRVGIWESDPISLAEDSGKRLFFRIIACCAFADLKHLGFDPNIECIDHIPRYINIPQIKDKNKKILYKIFKVLSTSEGLTGRGTFSFLVGRGQEFFTVKQVWQDLSRIPEFIHYADTVHELEEPCLSRLKGGTIVSIDGEYVVTANFRPKPSKAQHDRLLLRYIFQPVGANLAEFSSKIELLSVLLDIVWALKRLSDADLIHRDVTATNLLIQQTLSIRLIVKELMAELDKGETKVDWSKDFREELISILHSAEKGSDNSTYSADDSFSKEKEALFSELGIATELMRRGLLNDLDFAKYTMEYSTTDEYKSIFAKHEDKNISNARTGTTPFMPIEALQCFADGASNQYIHTIAHDLESLFYVLLWICVYYSGPRGKVRKFPQNKLPTLENWIKLDPSILADYKRGQLIENLVAEVDPYFNDMKDVLRDFYNALWNRKDMSDESRSRRTGSTVKHADIIEVLKKGIRALSKSSPEGLIRAKKRPRAQT